VRYTENATKQSPRGSRPSRRYAVAMATPAVPDPALIVLVGPSGSGKSSWAAARYRPAEVVSSDQLRGIVGSGENDLDASVDAFALLDQIAAARLRRGLTTVVDTLGFDAARRLAQLEQARRAGLPAVAVLFEAPAAECRRRNRHRDMPIPAAVLDSQLRRMTEIAGQVAGEGWDVVVRHADQAVVEAAHTPGSQLAAAQQRTEPAQLGFVLQVSRFGWKDEPAPWLAGIAAAAAEAGFEGIALMDHLIQIPQVGRDWEPIPEPWVTLGLLAGLTTGLRLGTLVTPVTFRAAGVLAKTVATLDALSGGRAFCGIGAGWWEREHAAFGLPFPPAAARLDQLEATTETLRALWRPGTKAYQGERVSLPETTCYPRPSAPVPIIVGGSGPRTLRIAARLADGCNLPAEVSVLDSKLAVLRSQCEAVGRDPAGVAVTVLDLPVLGRDREHAASIVERLRGRTAAAAFGRRHHAGVADDHIGRYRLLAERGVRTVFVALPDLAGPEDVLRFAPVAAAFG
jgi:alkanesulfonate monooxygenase SsuD/methylene tetrahydromethanopterin reductase-like flavin-dependent oxidoreductase (luciferase family)/predicted kinase